MRCSKAVEQLHLYVDHQLTLEQIRSLEAHLSSCPSCQEELLFLEEIHAALRGIEPVAEPANLTENVMRRVALSPRSQRELRKQHWRRIFLLLRPTLPEMLFAILLATITTLGIILAEPQLRALLPLVNGHDSFSQAFTTGLLRLFMGISESTLSWGLWIIGTLLGVLITLILVGREIRSTWFKAMLDRLPVW